MSQSVTIKSNKYGINLVLDPEIGFDELLKDVVETFNASSTFFKNAKLALSFEGRKLSDEEEQQILSAIESNTSIEILCIVENGTRQEAVMKEQVEAFYDAVQQQYENAAAGNGPEQFYRGTLRSGQVISSESSVTIIGDVNPGAKIISQGNIVILGALKGNAQAGCMGDRNCFIFALDMQPCNFLFPFCRFCLFIGCIGKLCSFWHNDISILIQLYIRFTVVQNPVIFSVVLCQTHIVFRNIQRLEIFKTVIK